MHIGLLVFSDFPFGDAPSRRIHMMAKGLAAIGHKVEVIVPQRFGDGAALQELDGFTIRWGAQTSANDWTRPRHRLAARLGTLRILRSLADAGLDWLLLSNPSADGVIFGLLSRFRGVQVISMYDDIRAAPTDWRLSTLLRLAWRNTGDILAPRLADVNIAISHFLAQRLRQRAPNKPTIIVPPLVDPGLFQVEESVAAAVRSQWAADGKTVISYAGTFWRVDGVHILLQAVATVKSRGGRIKLIISGMAHEGLDCVDVEEVVAALGLTDDVVLTGWLRSAGEVAKVLAAADILVVPKLDRLENVAGVPTKLAEYLAAGKPVIASEIGDIPRYVRNGDNGILVSPGDPDELVDALERLIRDPESRVRIGSAARESALEHFDYRTMAAYLVESLRSRERRDSDE